MRTDAAGIKVITALILVLFLFGTVVGCRACAGDGSWGFGESQRTLDVTVLSKHVDISGSGDSRASHYMVTTDHGTFEINNGWIMGVWNADELYGQLESNKKYRITVQGSTTTAFWTQTYPYVTRVTPLPQEVP